MLKIGDFSKLGLVTVKALRYYDERGLLKPVRVDELTGYRYYSASQLTRLNRILAMKDIGLDLQQIAYLMDKDPTPDQILGMLRLKQVELHQQVEEGQARLARLEAWLHTFEQEAKMPAYDILLKSVAPLRVAQTCFIAPGWEQVSPTLTRVFVQIQEHVRQQGVTWLIPGITLFHDNEHHERDISVSACLTFEGSVDDSEQVKVTELPGVEMMASVIHHGSFCTLHLAYNALLTWIANNGYQVNGPNRELNHVYKPGGDESLFVTEVQFPVEKR